MYHPFHFHLLLKFLKHPQHPKFLQYHYLMFLKYPLYLKYPLHPYLLKYLKSPKLLKYP